MTGIAEDYDAVFELIEEALDKLSRADPKHELLRYRKMRLGDKLYKAYVARFGKKGISAGEHRGAEAQTYMHAQYFLALRTALGKDVTISPKQEPIIPSSVPDEDDDPELPF